MVVYKFKDVNIYIDGRLKYQLDKKVLPDLKKKDKDAVFIVDGEERSGKSVFAMGLAAYASAYFESDFDLTNICMNPLEFRQKIEKSKKNQVIIYDEAHRGMASARSLSEINNILKDLMMEMGQLNLLVIIVLPTFFLLDKYAALFRARGLFHIYENKRRRGFWAYFNKKHKMTLYLKGKKEFNYNCMKWPYFRGKFYNQYPINEEEYRAKKAKSFKNKPRLTKAEKYIEQRNRLVYALHKELDMGANKLGTLMKIYKVSLRQSILGEILREFRGKQEETTTDGRKNSI